MELVLPALVIGALVGAVLGRASLQRKVGVLETELGHERRRVDELQQDRHRQGNLEQERLRMQQMVQPVRDNLARIEQFIASSERMRIEDQGSLFEQLREVADSTRRVSAEAASLKNVLRSSSAQRGRWGEVQLRRVVELAGMLAHADFSEQTSVTTDAGRSRADLVVYLPGDVKIAVDAKVPYGAYEQAQRTEDPLQQRQLFFDHAKQFRAHVDALAKRKYWEQYVPSSGFTVLFVPGEALLDAALAHDETLWEQAADKHILLATPSTLIALLRMAALGWRQESQTANAVEITKVGTELYRRLATFSNHIERMGRHLNNAVGSFNDFVGSMDSRVMPQARRLSDLGAGDDALAQLRSIDDTPRRARVHDAALLPGNDDFIVEEGDDGESGSGATDEPSVPSLFGRANGA